MTKELYIFNPDTDYALASGSVIYTPSKAVGEMIRRMTLYPALWASPGGVILSEIPVEKALAEAPDAIRGAIDRKKLRITDWKRVGKELEGNSPEIRPWGWNQVLAHRLMKAGVSLNNAPEGNWADRMVLASRKRTIDLNLHLAEKLPEFEIPVPRAIEEVEDVLSFRRAHGEAVLKDPWSSSGRGVLMTEGMTDRKIEEWCRGVLRRHGYVMAETVADRLTDCATLWEVTAREALFMGFSMFKTTERGKYLGQIIPDPRGMEYMREKLWFLRDDELTRRILSAQKEFLEREKRIEGYVGIDMLIEKNSNIRPGIEINRRMTMGTAALLIEKTMDADVALPDPFIKL